MGYLDELKRQADAARARSTDTGALERNRWSPTAPATPPSRYLGTLRSSSTCCSRCRRPSGASTAGPRSASCAAATSAPIRASKQLRDAEVFDHVVLGFAAKTGTRVTIAKDFPPEIEKLETRLRPVRRALRQRGDPADPGERSLRREALRVPAPTSGQRAHACPTTTPAGVSFQIVNLDGFETVAWSVPGVRGRHRQPRRDRALDHGRAARFLGDGQNLRRVVA